jgi:predicted dehydrogenase
MSKIRWGVLSTARIGTKTVIPAMQLGKYCTVTAIASRQLKKAQAAAGQLGIEKAYGSYEELLADPDIDAVYIPLPNHLHIPWTIKALNADKHVLCEKPIGLSADEAQALLDAAKKFPRLKVMEAFMYRHHPQWQWAKQKVTQGNNIRNKADIGGGGLMDIGCYCISLSRFIYGAEPWRACGIIEEDPNMKVDRLTSGILEFSRGTSTFTCATQLVPYQRVNIFGTKGRIEIEIPFNAPSDRPCKVWHGDGNRIEEIVLEVCNQYTIQGDLFSRAVLEDREVPVPLEDAVANMQVIKAIISSTRSSSWVNLETGTTT